MLPVQGIRDRLDLSMLLAGQLTGREDPSAIFDTTDRDELLGRDSPDRSRRRVAGR
jgi:hypothetical protein